MDIKSLIRDVKERKRVKKIGNGDFKIVYVHEEHPEWVIKKFFSYTEQDCKFYELPKKLKPFYVKPIYKRGLFQIQKKVRIDTRAFGSLSNLLDGSFLLNRYDIHSQNVGFLAGKPVFFDFLYLGF